MPDSSIDLLDEGASFAIPPHPSVHEVPFEAIEQALKNVAGAFDGLRNLLERLETSIQDARDQHDAEREIGELFTKAQHYLRQVVAEGEERARQLVVDAEFEAARILEAAKHEAHRIEEEARRKPALPPEAVRQLEITIEAFSAVNQQLSQELMALGNVLMTYAQTQPQPAATRQPGLPEYGPPPAPQEPEAGKSPWDPESHAAGPCRAHPTTARAFESSTPPHDPDASTPLEPHPPADAAPREPRPASPDPAGRFASYWSNFRSL
jgi:hypothetical protein